MYRHDASTYKIDDPIYIATSGWRILVNKETVAKVTPSGQIVTTGGVRINKNGKVIGDTGWSGRSVVSAERAFKIQQEIDIVARWQAVQTTCEHIMRAARNKNRDDLAAHIMELMTINEELKEKA